MIKLSWTVVPFIGGGLGWWLTRKGNPKHIPDEGGYRYVIFPRGLIPSPEFLSFAKLNLKFYPLPQEARGKTKIIPHNTQ